MPTERARLSRDPSLKPAPPEPIPPVNLVELIERMSEAHPDGATVRLENVLDAVGHRSFAPLLLLAGIITVSPLSGIPGIPSAMALLVLLISAQIVLGRHYFWLPRWLLHRGVPQKRYLQALKFLRRPARGLDRLLKPRLEVIVHKVGFTLILTVCILIALTMPIMEPLPFTASIAGAALSGFGLALLTRDGVAALISLAFTLTAGALIAKALL